VNGGTEGAYRRITGAKISRHRGPYFPPNIDDLAATLDATGNTTAVVNACGAREGFQRALDRQAGGVVWALVIFQVQDGSVVVALPAVPRLGNSPAVYLQGKATELEGRAMVTRVTRAAQALGR
jgi:hypothetical protein